MTGYSREELLNMHVSDLEAEENPDMVIEHFKKLMDQGWDRFESRHRCSGGTILDVLISTVYLSSQNIFLVFINDITDRKKAEEQLIIQSSALNAAANAIVITARDGHIEWVNPAFTELTGYALEEVSGKNPRSLKSGKHDAAFYKGLWDTILSGNVWRGEMINIRKDGTEYREEMTITPVMDQHGEIIRFIAIKQNITDRINLEIQLYEQKLTVEFILDHTLAGYWDWDIPAGRLYMSPAFKRMFGYEDHELPNIIDTLQNIMFPEDYPKAMACLDSHFNSKGEVPYRIVLRYLHKNGVVIWVICSGKVISWDEEYKPLRMVGSHVDITEQKRIEEEIQKLQLRIDYIYGATKTGLHIIDSDLALTYVNPALHRIYGDYHGRKCFYYFKQLQEPCLECLVLKSFETGSSVVFETSYPLENNRPVQATAIPFKDNLGNWFVAEVTFDITERKRVEEELSKAKTEAEQANQAKSEFLSRMSHELRTPLNSILGFAQLMEMGELKPAQKKGVDQILKSGKYLLNLINEVLDLSRIEAGKLVLSAENIPIREIILETMDSVGPLASTHEIRMELTESVPGDLRVHADRHHLKQVLLNLLSNAIKYNRPGGSVTIDLIPGSPLLPAEVPDTTRTRAVLLRISDTGFGISTENLERIFLPFQRIDQEKKQIEGTGLGLAVVKKLMEAMGGTVGVESREGVGSAFWIELPLTESI